ncbi:MAG TPA: hypothetical protein VMU25_02325 [Candidatus Paceibacterota bacterium]|nr:hypothetical protein [Candidatus Paceibacterota bacterium]
MMQQKEQTTAYVAAALTPQSTTSPVDALSASIDPITNISDTALGEIIGAYTGLQHNGMYSTSTVENVGGTIGAQLHAPVTYSALTANAIATNPDTSYQAMMSYRTALQKTLKPLTANTLPEYELFGLYVQTKDQSYLNQLKTAESNYIAAASSTAALTVPSDAVAVQLGLVNSMREFAATLDALIAHADDPIASTILLKNYNQAENDVLTAFQALVTYEKSKTQ